MSVRRTSSRVLETVQKAGAISAESGRSSGGSVTFHFASLQDAQRFHQAVADYGIACRRKANSFSLWRGIGAWLNDTGFG